MGRPNEDGGDPSTHWRFVRTDSHTITWAVRNRKTGQVIGLNQPYQAITVELGAKLQDYSAVWPFKDFTCTSMSLNTAVVQLRAHGTAQGICTYTDDDNAAVHWTVNKPDCVHQSWVISSVPKAQSKAPDVVGTGMVRPKTIADYSDAMAIAALGVNLGQIA